MNEEYQWMVCVRCMTYNHAAYIEDAMNGFCMQETSFPYVCCIVDDCSADGEPDVIKNYLQEYFDLEDKSVVRNEVTDDYVMTYAQHKRNKNCFFAVFYLKYNHHQLRKAKVPYLVEWTERAKYIALCEGDDYWIHLKKLQLQASFLESHPDYSMCFGALYDVLPSGEKVAVHRYNEDKLDCSVSDLHRIGGGYAKINSMMIRQSMYGEGYIVWVINPPVGDFPMQLTLFEVGKVAYHNKLFSCYRRMTSNSWSQRIVNSKPMQANYYKGMKRMWSAYDEFTKGKYSKVVRRWKRKNLTNFIYLRFIYFVKPIVDFIRHR